MTTTSAKKCKCAAHAGDERWHGTPGGRQYHGCDCERCTTGAAKYMADYWQARKAGRAPRTKVCGACGLEFTEGGSRYCSPECREAGRRKQAALWKQLYDARLTQQLADRRRRLLAAQGGVCALCRKPLKLAQATVDHDHACCDTKARRACGRCDRGVLHRLCNVILGAARDSGETLELPGAADAQWRSQVR